MSDATIVTECNPIHACAKNPSSSFFMKPSQLYLENGDVLHGLSPFWQEGDFYGELVFTTGMTGYDASLTDPSYAGQILVFTSPLIGNYGVPCQSQWESEKIYAAGVVVSTVCEEWNHGQSTQSLMEWLKAEGVPLISGIDTRHVTKRIRDSGTMLGVISSSNHTPSFDNYHKKGSFEAVSPLKPVLYLPNNSISEKKIIVIDCGIKNNILRCLQQFPVEILRVPYDYDFSSEDFDGIVLSNGPGDPTNYTAAFSNLRKAMKQEKPIFGICLGAQLLSLAAGAKTYKLPFGHRGHNQPCIDLNTQRCYITSQNHGYAIDEKSLPSDWQVTFRNLNDQTVEGIAHAKLPFSAVQFHPEGAPGPTDTAWLFERFFSLLFSHDSNKESNNYEQIPCASFKPS